MSTLGTKPPAVHYPDSDGQPMADNTLQFEWIVTLQGNIDLLFRDNPDVFVAGDHLIYPVQGSADVRQAPDVYVAFGRPKGYRGSYKVWEEAGVFPQVVFEVWSPNNRYTQMEDKREFYERHGAEEYYIVYPDFPAHVDGWRREGGKFVRIPELNGWVSPLLGVRFELRRGEVAVYGPDGGRFLNFVENGARAQEEHRLAVEARKQADQEHRQAEAARQQAEREQQRAEAERERATTAQQQAEAERERAAKLAAKLRELGVDPDAV